MTFAYSELPRASIAALGIETSYIMAGKPGAPLVMLLHGMSNSGDAYREVIHELADDYWLIAPDLPGFGASGNTEPYNIPHLVEWLASFREALELPPMILVGHSFGGAIAASYTITYPEEVSRLLLVAPAILAGQMFPGILKRIGISLGLVDLGATLTQSSTFMDQNSSRPFYDPDSIPETVWSRRSDAFQQSRAAAGVLKSLAFHDMRPLLGAIHQPVCIIWGREDPVLPATQAGDIADRIPQAEVLVWEECGHIPFLEKQTMFLTAARRFFRGEPTAGHSTSDEYDRPVISVFGGSTPQPGSSAYLDARLVGRFLAEAGFAVATGGYSGTMTAVSQGAAEAGGFVIGVTSDQIEQFRPLGPNPWIHEEIRYQTLQDRLIHLVRQNQGIIVLPGGIGTLSEMALAWSYLQVGEMAPKPLALLGDHWRTTVNSFLDPFYVRPEHVGLLFFADSTRAAVDHIVARVPRMRTRETSR